MTSSIENTPTIVCIIPTTGATAFQRREYLACRAKSLAYQAQELSHALVREHFTVEAREARGISTALTNLSKGIDDGPLAYND